MCVSRGKWKAEPLTGRSASHWDSCRSGSAKFQGANLGWCTASEAIAALSPRACVAAPALATWRILLAVTTPDKRQRTPQRLTRARRERAVSFELPSDNGCSGRVAHLDRAPAF